MPSRPYPDDSHGPVATVTVRGPASKLDAVELLATKAFHMEFSNSVAAWIPGARPHLQACQEGAIVSHTCQEGAPSSHPRGAASQTNGGAPLVAMDAGC